MNPLPLFPVNAARMMAHVMRRQATTTARGPLTKKTSNFRRVAIIGTGVVGIWALHENALSEGVGKNVLDSIEKAVEAGMHYRIIAIGINLSHCSLLSRAWI